MMTEEELNIMYVDPKKLKPFEYSRKIFPELQGNAYDLLKEDIKENGIRTPLEVTTDFLILCGHERHRVALELGLEKVPVEIYPSVVVEDQKIRLIKDNLARKDVTYRTKIRCYRELQELYGIKRGEYGGESIKGKEGFQPRSIDSSTERPMNLLSEDEIAKEVGLSRPTLERAEAIDKSDLPESIKNAALSGEIGIRPVAELVSKPKELQDKIIPKVLERLEEGKNPALDRLIIETESEMLCEKEEDEQIANNIESFFTRYGEALKHNPTPKIENNEVKIAIDFFKRLLQTKKIVCPVCGESKLEWTCGHEF